MGTENELTVVIGKYGSSTLIVWPNENLEPNKRYRNSGDGLILGNLLGYLTKGSCTNYSLCYRPIEDFQKYANISNLVFGTSYYSKFDVKNFQNLINQKNWNFIFTEVVRLSGIPKYKEELLKLYGICVVTAVIQVPELSNEKNICKKITKFNKELCK